MDLQQTRIGIIGLGYVGLPLAVEFGKQFPTVGFDLQEVRISELQRGHDCTLETTSDELLAASQLSFTTEPADMADCNVYIITVPTPIDRWKRPDLTPLERASKTVGKLLKPGDTVIYESTVYPGATEEVCVPILSKESGLGYRCTLDQGTTHPAIELTERGSFYVGYSPERINPGDKEHRLVGIRKVTSGSTPEIADYIDRLYGKIIEAGTHKASTIRVAEAAKVIENTQRDVNIALINELAMLFNHLGIDTEEVLATAGSKWNFLPFRPGLVGGHCIGVDPYYLTHKAQEIGFHTEMILAGRRINDYMGSYVVQEVIKLMAQRHLTISGSRVLVLGITFKENCPDIRNTKVTDIQRGLESYGALVEIHDPWANFEETRQEYGINLVQEPEPGRYDAIILAVAHQQFKSLGSVAIRQYGHTGTILYDVKNLFPPEEVDGRL